MSSAPPEIPLLPVKSSTVAAVGYDASDQVLVVQFLSSSEPYYYRDVPAGIWRWMQIAPSKGKFLHAYVRGRFPFSRTYPVLHCQVHDVIQITDGAHT